MAHPATKKRGGDPDVKHGHPRKTSKDDLDRQLEEGLEETMAGSDPVSVTQPVSGAAGRTPEKKDQR
jgi:hypothetical protein